MVRGYGLITLLLACGMTAGCATVDPRPDYERVARHVADATGQEALYRPGDEEAVNEKVEALLADGLTSKKAVQICLLNNQELQAAFFEVGVARADVVQSGLLSNPSLGVSARLPAGGGLANLEAGLAQNIADLWQVPVRRRVAERALDQAILELARRASVLATQAKMAYYRAVAADRRKKIAEENVEIVQRLLQLALARQEAGVGTEVEVNLSQAELRETELALYSARLSAFSARSELAALLGLIVSPHKLDLHEPLPDPPEWTFSAEKMLEIANARRLDLRAGMQAVAAAAANADLERLRVFPVIEFGLELEREARPRSRGRRFLAETARSSIEAGELTPPSMEGPEDREADFVIGPTLSLELPIFDQNQAQIAKTEYVYLQTVRMLEGLSRRVAQEVGLAYERARTAWEAARFYQDRLLPLREANLKLARQAYRAGRTSFLSVLEAQRTLLTARAAFVNTLEGSVAALVELERVTGQPVDKILAAVDADATSSSQAGRSIPAGEPAADRSATSEERR